MGLHSVRCSNSNYIDSDPAVLKSFNSRYVLTHDRLDDKVELLDTFSEVKRHLKLVGFPDNISSCMFYWLYDRIWHVIYVFTSSNNELDEQRYFFCGKVCVDIEQDQIILLNKHELELTADQQRLCDFRQLNNGTSTYSAWIRRHYYDNSHLVDVYRYEMKGDKKPQKLLSVELTDFERHLHVTAFTLIEQMWYYFLKDPSSMYVLLDDDVKICFFEKLYCYNIETKEQTMIQTKEFPDFSEHLNNYRVDPKLLWHDNRLHVLLTHRIWSSVAGNFMPKLLVFDINTLNWNVIEFQDHIYLEEIKLVYIDRSGILTFRFEEKKYSEYFIFHRCPLKQPDKLANLSLFKVKQLKQNCVSEKIINVIKKF